MKGIISLITGFVLICILFPTRGGMAAEPNGIEAYFFKANQAYGEGRFKEAISGYHRIIESGQSNGHLYYNLANAYFREKDLGRAILFYERARLFIPRDGDLNFNLRYALDRSRDALAESQDFLGQTFFWLNGLTLEEIMKVFITLNILFWGILVLRLFIKPEWTYYTFLLIFVLWLIGGLSFGAKWYQIETDNRCIVLPAEVAVHAGPQEADTVLFKLHQGAVVNGVRSEDGWTLVRLPDKKRGWMKNAAFERVIPR